MSTQSTELIQEKLELLDTYVQRLMRLQSRTLEEFREDVEAQWAVEHGLQLCIQCVVDVAKTLVRGQGQSPAGHSVDAVELLHQRGIVSAALGANLPPMVRFRNVLVHRYATVNVDLVHQFLMTGLGDFDEFSEQVLAYLDGSVGPEESE